MKKEYLELITGLLILAAAYLLPGPGLAAVRQCMSERAVSGKYCVVIDAGHGGNDPGKVSPGGLEEKDINLQIAWYLKELLEAQDVIVYMTRTEDAGLHKTDSANKKTEDLRRRCELINGKAPDCAVSIHQNSYHEPEIKGAQTFYYEESGEGKRLAEALQESLIRRADPDNHRKVKSNDSYYMLKQTEVPIAIAECGFLSNPEEAEKLADPEYQKKLAWALHIGILRYLSEEKTPEKSM